MARITVEDCIDKFESRFELVLVASNRARKLHSGEKPEVDKDNDKNTVIALREIADDAINIEDLKNNLVEEYQAVSTQNEEDLSLEYVDYEKNNENKDNQEEVTQTNEELFSNSNEDESQTEKEIINHEEEKHDVQQDDNISENL